MGLVMNHFYKGAFSWSQINMFHSACLWANIWLYYCLIVNIFNENDPGMLKILKFKKLDNMFCVRDHLGVKLVY